MDARAIFESLSTNQDVWSRLQQCLVTFNPNVRGNHSQFEGADVSSGLGIIHQLVCMYISMHTLRIWSVCPKKGIFSPTVLLWGWDFLAINPMRNREGSDGFLGIAKIYDKKRCFKLTEPQLHRPFEQWKKPWLFMVHRGWNPTQ